MTIKQELKELSDAHNRKMLLSDYWLRVWNYHKEQEMKERKRKKLEIKSGN